jgi:serine protease inhibitor ecotin
MKTLLALSAAFAILAALPHDAHAQYKKYDIKSGIITFETVIEMGTMKMKNKVMVYFDDYGTKECNENYTGGKLRNSLFSDGQMKYLLLHDQKTVETRGKEYRGTEYRFDWNEIPENDRTSGMAKKLPNVTVAGKNCESYMVGSSTDKTVYAGWGHVCLMMDISSSTMRSLIKATKFEENAKVPPEKFAVPAGYKMR